MVNLTRVKADYVWTTRQIVDVASRHCAGHIIACLEGGYELSSLARSAAAHVKVLLGISAKSSALRAIYCPVCTHTRALSMACRIPYFVDSQTAVTTLETSANYFLNRRCLVLVGILVYRQIQPRR